MITGCNFHNIPPKTTISNRLQRWTYSGNSWGGGGEEIGGDEQSNEGIQCHERRVDRKTSC